MLEEPSRVQQRGRCEGAIAARGFHDGASASGCERNNEQAAELGSGADRSEFDLEEDGDGVANGDSGRSC